MMSGSPAASTFRDRRLRPVAAVLVLVLAAVPIVDRICDLGCDAVPGAGEETRAACPAHPAPAKPPPREDRAHPCGHAHSSEGALLAAAGSSGAKNGPDHSKPFATVPGPIPPPGARLPLCRDEFLRLPSLSRARPAPSVLRL